MTYHSIAIHTLLLSLLHLSVDGICACGLMLILCQRTNYIESCGLIVLYDILAFATQPLTGCLADVIGKSGAILKTAIVLLIFGALVSLVPYIINFYTAIICTILLGMGNSFFHVYGGKYVAITSSNDIRMLGVFVSTGAVGLATGLGFSSPVLMSLFLLALSFLSALHLLNTESVKITKPLPVLTERVKQFFNQSLPTVPFLFLFCLMFVVTGRAFIGESVPPMNAIAKSTGYAWSIVLVSIIVMFGKAMGGFLSKMWGVRNVFCVTMLLSATNFLMFPWHDVFVLTTLFLVNISMPCTLYWALKVTPGREGWAFGLLAMALLPGFLLGYLSRDIIICKVLLAPLMATILLESFLLLCIHERKWQVLATSVGLNILTNVPLNAFVITYKVTSPFFIICMECIVVAVEFIGYWFVLHDRLKAFKYSFLCNSFSALVGFLFQYYFVNFHTF